MFLYLMCFNNWNEKKMNGARVWYTDSQASKQWEEESCLGNLIRIGKWKSNRVQNAFKTKRFNSEHDLIFNVDIVIQAYINIIPKGR